MTKSSPCATCTQVQSIFDRLRVIEPWIPCAAGAVFGAGRGGPHDGARLGVLYSAQCQGHTKRAYGCTCSAKMIQNACFYATTSCLRPVTFCATSVVVH